MPIPFFVQEQSESCVPACVRMVLASRGLEHAEAEIYELCGTDNDGTLPSAAARCIEQLGLSARATRLTDLLALQAEHVDAVSIAFVNLAPLLGVQDIHAVIIEDIDSERQQITVIDPSHLPDGRRTWGLSLFEMGWRLARNQTILIAR